MFLSLKHIYDIRTNICGHRCLMTEYMYVKSKKNKLDVESSGKRAWIGCVNDGHFDVSV